MKNGELLEAKPYAPAFVTLCALALITTTVLGGPAQSKQSAQPPADSTYTWHAELVALDAGAKTATVKAMAVGDALKELPQFKPGDRVMLGWSGFDKFANAINHAVKFDGTKKLDDRFAFPVEFVAFDAEHRYATFKAPIPSDGVSRLQALKPGQWITATSPHGAASQTQPIVSIRSYNNTAPASS
jgi:hypothetical protein